MPRLTQQGNPPSKQQSKMKNEPAIYMCKKTSKNGVLLKEYHCMHPKKMTVNLQIATKLQDASSMHLFIF